MASLATQGLGSAQYQRDFAKAFGKVQAGVWLDEPPNDFAVLLRRNKNSNKNNINNSNSRGNISQGNNDNDGEGTPHRSGNTPKSQKHDIDNASKQASTAIMHKFNFQYVINDPFSLQITSFDDLGSVAEWNLENGYAKYRDIRRFDRIYEVDGLQGNAPLLAKALEEAPEEVRLMVRRPREVAVNVQRGSAGLGLGLAFDDNMILIDRLNEDGAVAAWNKAHPQQQQVRVGDRILSVNKVDETTQAMLETLGKEQSLDIVFAQ
mmetsp:Transcript_51823/g.112655  ORF Transcript_51823/g.112655 Transcript_51823/m.112655 type:complete len:264 (-) Transcript_51823:57-848(-)|eukprot:CAMPEP_0206563200 /NCGR_PEP_ID=MMETSP0325_2-20121206/22709_1 /ASSEMBLY_ACC=CAM_ASM_000347 /TAXON_ID=2866 /ORGANISM="Crypthecodinium cohnii, Strain Seligo" /LENGTH=263 /DNA_ID=CAMNT_0054065569 /DNA_START=19 /DNA_END=810 /DNA_ORIENTATION=-